MNVGNVGRLLRPAIRATEMQLPTRATQHDVSDLSADADTSRSRTLGIENEWQPAYAVAAVDASRGVPLDDHAVARVPRMTTRQTPRPPKPPVRSYAALECLLHRTPVGNLEESSLLFGDAPCSSIFRSMRAMPTADLSQFSQSTSRATSASHFHALERHPLIRVEPKRHRRAATQRAEQILWRRPGVGAARVVGHR